MLDLKSFRLQPHSAEIVPPLEVMIPVMVCLSMQRGEEFLCVSWAALQGLLHIVSYYIKRAVKLHYFCNVNFLLSFCMWMCVTAQSHKVSRIPVMARLVLSLLLLCGCQNR